MTHKRDPGHDIVSDTGVEGGVDEPNEDSSGDADGPEGESTSSDS